MKILKKFTLGIAIALLLSVWVPATPVFAVDVVMVNPADELSLLAGEDLSTGDVVYIKAADGKFWKADTDLAIAAWGIVKAGANGSVSSGAIVNVAKRGKIIGESSLTINGDVFLTATAGSYDQTGVAAFNQRLGVATKADEIIFDIGGASGNIVAGTLSSTGAASFGSTVAITGNVSVNTNKFTVTAASGNTLIAGTGDITGNLAVNTNKFTVAASTGNTVIAGTAGITGDVAVNTNKFNVTAATGATAVADDITIATTKALNIGTQQIAVEDGVEGVSARRIALASFTFSDQATDGAYDTGVTIPDNAVITGFGYDVITTIGGNGDDSSTLAIHVEGANDMVTAVAIQTGTPWDAGLHEGIPQPDDASTWVKTTSAQNITVTVDVLATDTALDAGEMSIWVEYIVTQ